MSDAPPPVVTYRTVPEIPGLLVGDDGSIARLDVLRPWRAGSGHRVRLGGRTPYLNLRRRILEAFRGPCPDGMEPASLDGDAGNLALDNLRWSPRRDAPLDPADLPARGGDHGRARLDEARVIDARRLRRAGWTHGRIAARLGVHESTVQALLSGRSWGHVPEPRAAPPPGVPRSALLDPAKVAEARALHAGGPPWTARALAARYGVALPTMADALSGRSWKGVAPAASRGAAMTKNAGA